MSEFQELNKEYQELTGKDLFLYASQPNPRGSTNYVFTDRNFTNRGNALEFLRLKVEHARQTQAGRPDTTTEPVRQPHGGNGDAP